MRFPFSVSSITFVILCLFDNSHADWCGVISHCGFCLPFLIVMLNIFSSACWPSVCLLWKNIYSDPLPIFLIRLLVFFLLLSPVEYFDNRFD